MTRYYFSSTTEPSKEAYLPALKKGVETLHSSIQHTWLLLQNRQQEAKTLRVARELTAM